MAAATFDEFRQLAEVPPDDTPDSFIPIKGENGLRLTKDQIETPVVHVAGTFDVPEMKAKAKTAKKQLELALPIAFDLPIDEEKFAGMLAWAVEREAARLRREGMASAPATPEPQASVEGATISDPHAVPAYILDDVRIVPEAPRATKAPNVFPSRPSSPPPGAGSGQQRYGSTTSSPHGDEGPPRGEKRNTWIYDSLDQEMYLLVEKWIDWDGGKHFHQYHWAGNHWERKVKGTYAERKVPYQLRVLKAALAANPDTEVNITEGEKDAETLRRFGLVATTNPGGANQWNEDLTAWLRILGVRRAVIHEDNDDAGRKRTEKIAAALSGFAKVRVAKYLDTPDGGDVTDWVEAGRTRADLETRIAQASPFEEAWRRAPIATWAGKRAPEQEYTLPDRFPAEETGLLSGEGAIGKSILLLMLCAAHVLGREYLGVVPRQGATIHIECEDAETVLWRRLEPIAAYYGVPIETFARDLHLFSLREIDSTILAVTNKQGVVEPTAAYRRLYEMAGDLKPVQITIASVANVFAGNELNRTEVQQFVRLMTRLATLTKGSAILATHPSLTGLSDKNISHAGLSGSTQWHNAVRARAALALLKPKDEGEGEANGTVDTGLRTLTFYKNQYGPPVAGLVLEWRNGLYLPVAATVTSGPERAAVVEAVALALLKRFAAQGRTVSINVNPANYAPTTFAEAEEARAAGFTKRDFKAALERLLGRGVIENVTIEGGRGRHCLRIKPEGE
jgi:RecA-family ATPase